MKSNFNNLERAKEILNSDDYTCVLCKNDIVYTSKSRGVKPLLDWLDNKTDLHGFSAADKVVGKATAFLYVLCGVAQIYAPVISEPARDILIENGIIPVCDKEVKAIRNRTDTGFCPMETAVYDIDNPHEALTVIKNTLTKLQKNTM